MASDAGIGYRMAVAASDSNTSLAFAGRVVLAAMGSAFYAICGALERRVTRWAYPR